MMQTKYRNLLGLATPLHYMSLATAAAHLRTRQVSAVELTQAILTRIEELDPKLRAYAEVTPERALAQARDADNQIAKGRYHGPLHGIPIAVKDVFFTRGIRTAAGMTIYSDHRPDCDATVVARLDEAGAVLLGKLQLTEGALSHHHPSIDAPRNPWAQDQWPGVSSSGCGVATAAGLCFGCVATDTGGSIRYPAAANGVTGLKTTWGRISRHGSFALAPSLDHVGPMARTALDAAIILNALTGADPRDSSTLTAAAHSEYIAGTERDIAGLRVGVCTRYSEEGSDPDVIESLRLAQRVFADLGAQIRHVQLPDPSAVIEGWAPLCGAEAAVTHAATYPAQSQSYGPALANLLELGRNLTASELATIRTARHAFTQALVELFEYIDLLLIPVQPFTNPTLERIDEIISTPQGLRLALRFTAPFNMSGNPAITLPGAFTAAGLPLGFQLIAGHFREPSLLAAGRAYQQSTTWHLQHPLP
jgi:amidase